MKTKVKITAYQKALALMERETARAVAQVNSLEKLYEEMKKAKIPLDKSR